MQWQVVGAAREPLTPCRWLGLAPAQCPHEPYYVGNYQVSDPLPGR